MSELPAQRGGAKALLLTVLGEFVLPAGGTAWTSSLVRAASGLGISERNARQAISRIAERGLLTSHRHGRSVQWSLTDAGTQLLKVGADRIYTFGTSTVVWDGTWIVAHCPISETQRAVRNQLRTKLAFLGFGELSPSLVVSPHVERESELRSTLQDLDLLESSVVMRSTTDSTIEDHNLVDRAWDLSKLAASYDAFRDQFVDRSAVGAEQSFRATVELVHDWRRFPFSDPELPTELLPDPWAGADATAVFHDRHAQWSRAAKDWFAASS